MSVFFPSQMYLFQSLTVIPSSPTPDNSQGPKQVTEDEVDQMSQRTNSVRTMSNRDVVQTLDLSHPTTRGSPRTLKTGFHPLTGSKTEQRVTHSKAEYSCPGPLACWFDRHASM